MDMKSFILLSFVSFLCLVTNCFAQKKICCVGRLCICVKENNKPKTKTIRFNKDGKWIDGFLSTISKGDIVEFVIEDDRTKTEELLEVSKRIEAFKNSNDFGKLSIENPIYPLLFKDANEYKAFIDSESKKIENLINDIFKLDPLYKIEFSGFTKDGKCSKKLIPSTLKTSDAQDICNKKIILFTKILTIDDDYERIEFKLKREHYDNQIIAKYLEETEYLKDNKYKSAYYDYDIYIPKIKELNENLTVAFESIIKLMKEDSVNQATQRFTTNNFTLTPETQNKICKIFRDNSQKLISLENILFLIIEKNKEWIKSWLWYNKGNTFMNPLALSKPTGNIDEINQNISLYAKKIELLNAYAKNSPTNFAFLETQLQQINNALATENKKKVSFEKKQNDYDKSLKKLSESSNILYMGTLFGSNSNSIQWMHHYDSSNDFLFSNSKETLPNWVSEIDDVVVLSNNLGKSSKIKLETTITKETLKTPLETGLAVFTDVLDEANKGKDDISALFGILSFNNSLKKLDYVSKSQIREATTCLNLDSLRLLCRHISSAEWLLSQTKPLLELELNANTDTTLYSKFSFPDELKTVDKTFKVNYEIKSGDKTEAVAKGIYKKNELVRWWPATGISYLKRDKFVSVYENGEFKDVAAEIGSIEPIVGVKFYPFKTNIVARCKDTKLTKLRNGAGYSRQRGNSIINRISFFAGLSANKRVFKNYFIGVGIDPWPGFNIQIGTNFYFQKSYVLENGEILSSSEKLAKPIGYFAITFDQGVVSKILKLF